MSLGSSPPSWRDYALVPEIEVKIKQFQSVQETRVGLILLSSSFNLSRSKAFLILRYRIKRDSSAKLELISFVKVYIFNKAFAYDM